MGRENQLEMTPSQAGSLAEAVIGGEDKRPVGAHHHPGSWGCEILPPRAGRMPSAHHSFPRKVPEEFAQGKQTQASGMLHLNVISSCHLWSPIHSISGLTVIWPPLEYLQ